MIEELKTLQIDDTIIFSDDQVVEFLEDEELTVTGIKIYSNDESEMVMVEMDEFRLVIHNFESEEKCFIYQLVEEGDVEDLEDEGYKFLTEEDDFRHKIAVRESGKTYVYYPSDAGAIYGLVREDEDVTEDISLCEFQSSSAHLSSILIEKEDRTAYIMQGFEISEEDFELK